MAVLSPPRPARNAGLPTRVVECRIMPTGAARPVDTKDTNATAIQSRAIIICTIVGTPLSSRWCMCVVKSNFRDHENSGVYQRAAGEMSAVSRPADDRRWLHPPVRLYVYHRIPQSNDSDPPRTTVGTWRSWRLRRQSHCTAHLKQVDGPHLYSACWCNIHTGIITGSISPQARPRTTVNVDT